MDQRNAGGRCRVSPIMAGHLAADQLAVTTSLPEFPGMGGCIGGSNASMQSSMRPTASRPVLRPRSACENRENWDAASSMATRLPQRDRRSARYIASFGRTCFPPTRVFRHPGLRQEAHAALPAAGTASASAHTSAEIAELAPNIEVQTEWRGPEFLQESIQRVHDFLARNTPRS